MKIKLQEILKWLSLADKDQINGLWKVIIERNLYFLDDVFDRDVYEKLDNE